MSVPVQTGPALETPSAVPPTIVQKPPSNEPSTAGPITGASPEATAEGFVSAQKVEEKEHLPVDLESLKQENIALKAKLKEVEGYKKLEAELQSLRKENDTLKTTLRGLDAARQEELQRIGHFLQEELDAQIGSIKQTKTENGVLVSGTKSVEVKSGHENGVKPAAASRNSKKHHKRSYKKQKNAASNGPQESVESVSSESEVEEKLSSYAEILMDQLVEFFAIQLEEVVLADEEEKQQLANEVIRLKTERDHLHAQLEDLRVTGKFKDTVEHYEKRLSDFASDRDDIGARVTSLEALLCDKASGERAKEPVNETLPPIPPAPQVKNEPLPTQVVDPQTVEVKSFQAESKEVVANPAPVPAKRVGSADIVGFGKKKVLILRNGIHRQIITASLKFTLDDGWDNAKHIRTLGDTTGDGHLDLIGFKDDGVYVSRNKGDNTFDAPQLVHTDMGYNAKWRVEKHPRFAARLRNKGYVDLVAFGEEGVYMTKNIGNGKYPPSTTRVLKEYGYDKGWRTERHIRLLADLTGNGVPDIIGFGEEDVSVCLGKGDGTFGKREVLFSNLSVKDKWELEKHPRLLGDITGNGKPDIVGFGEEGVFTCLNKGDGTFEAPKLVLKDFGHVRGVSSGTEWRTERHLRYLADMNGDGRLDIVGFGDEGVYVAFSNGDGTFQPAKLLLDTFGYEAGGWRVDKHPRFVVDLTGDGYADIVAFGEESVYVSYNDGKGNLGPFEALTNQFAFRGGEWDPSQTVRYVTNVF